MHSARRGGRGNRWLGLLPAALLGAGVACGGAGEAPAGEEQPVDEAAPGLPGGDEAPKGTPEAPGASSPAPDAPGASTPASPASPGVTTPPSPGAQRPTPPARGRTWVKVFGGPQDDSGTGVAVGRGGDVVLVASSTPRSDEDREPVEGERLALTLARYSPEGAVRWSREFVRDRLSGTRVAASGDGAVFLSGNAFLYPADFGLGEAQDGFLVRFSPDGEPQWQRRVGQKAHAVAADAAGGVLAAGEEWTAEVKDPVLTRYGVDGSVRWTRRFEGTGEGTVLGSVALAPSGMAVLAGQLADTLEVDGRTFGTRGVRGFVVLAFSEEGRLAWGKALPGVRGRVTSVAAGADGAVTVAGDFTGLLVWGGASLGTPGPFVLGAGADGSERWLKQPACGPVTELGPVAAVEEEGPVAVACGSMLTRYGAEGAWLEELQVPVASCGSGRCVLAAAGMAVVPGKGLAVTGWQRDGAGTAWNQDAFLRLVVP